MIYEGNGKYICECECGEKQRVTLDSAGWNRTSEKVRAERIFKDFMWKFTRMSDGKTRAKCYKCARISQKPRKPTISYRIYYGEEIVYEGKTTMNLTEKLKNHFVQWERIKIPLDLNKVTKIEYAKSIEGGWGLLPAWEEWEHPGTVFKWKQMLAERATHEI
jgi:hypothetical protein